LRRERDFLIIPKNSLLGSLANLRKRSAELKGFSKKTLPNSRKIRIFPANSLLSREFCPESSSQPDYVLAAPPDSERQLVEVTEMLDPGSKYQQEHRETLEQVEWCGTDLAARDLPESPASYESDFIKQARVMLEGEFDIPDPRGDWLILYFQASTHAPGREVCSPCVPQLYSL
jgi:hypothetical protein